MKIEPSSAPEYRALPSGEMARRQAVAILALYAEVHCQGRGFDSHR
ncbi:MAG: hypothetical protein ACLQIJ_04235 [Polyangia bacterium]|jgi:hypothetical protein